MAASLVAEVWTERVSRARAQPCFCGTSGPGPLANGFHCEFDPLRAGGQNEVDEPEHQLADFVTR